MTRDGGRLEGARAWASLVLAALAAAWIATPRWDLARDGANPEADELQGHLTDWAAVLAPVAEHVAPDAVLGFACPKDAAGKPEPSLDFKFGLIQAALAPLRIARGASDGPVVAHEGALAELCRARGWPSARVLLRLSKSWAIVDSP